MSEPPFRPREKLIEKQRYFQSIKKLTYVKGRYDIITSIAIPLALTITSVSLIARGIYNMSHGIGKKDSYPLSIVLVGVGDGPWEDMKNFDDKIPAHVFDNFQFVNFTAIMSKNGSQSEKETAFALAALMDIPIQYKATLELGLLGHVTGKAREVVIRPPPVPFNTLHPQSSGQQNSLQESTTEDRNQACPICLTNVKDLAFGCGHMTCRECGPNLSICPICRAPIRSRLRLYSA